MEGDDIDVAAFRPLLLPLALVQMNPYDRALSMELPRLELDSVRTRLANLGPDGMTALPNCGRAACTCRMVAYGSAAAIAPARAALAEALGLRACRPGTLGGVGKSMELTEDLRDMEPIELGVPGRSTGGIGPALLSTEDSLARRLEGLRSVLSDITRAPLEDAAPATSVANPIDDKPPIDSGIMVAVRARSSERSVRLTVGWRASARVISDVGSRFESSEVLSELPLCVLTGETSRIVESRSCDGSSDTTLSDDDAFWVRSGSRSKRDEAISRSEGRGEICGVGPAAASRSLAESVWYAAYLLGVAVS